MQTLCGRIGKIWPALLSVAHGTLTVHVASVSCHVGNAQMSAQDPLVQSATSGVNTDVVCLAGCCVGVICML